jgi:serine acetyltransferase
VVGLYARCRLPAGIATVTEAPLRGLRNRVFQHIARFAPGAMTLRVRLHRWRGVRIGRDVWIGYDSIIETSRPQLVSIGDRVSLGIRTTIIGHFHEAQSVTIENDVFIGPGVIILPNVTVGHGSVVAAGSVVTMSVAPGTLVQGNPARPVAKCGIPLGLETSVKEFSRNLRPIRREPSTATRAPSHD